MTPDEPLRLDFLPWEYKRKASEEERERQAERQARLGGSIELAEDVYVAESAAVYCDELRMGERSYIAAHAYVTGQIVLGSDSTINPFAAVRGRITIGDGVRIGAHTSLIAFNHGTAPGQPIFQQPHTALGITIGDDVWIGSNVTILDGVTIGPHTIIGAGAVVTKDVPANTIAAGNPARVLRTREVGEEPAASSQPRPPPVPPGRRLVPGPGRRPLRFPRRFIPARPPLPRRLGRREPTGSRRRSARAAERVCRQGAGSGRRPSAALLGRRPLRRPAGARPRTGDPAVV